MFSFIAYLTIYCLSFLMLERNNEKKHSKSHVFKMTLWQCVCALTWCSSRVPSRSNKLAFSASTCCLVSRKLSISIRAFSISPCNCPLSSDIPSTAEFTFSIHYYNFNYTWSHFTSSVRTDTYLQRTSKDSFILDRKWKRKRHHFQTGSYGI